MFSSVFALALTAHLAGDFLLQSEKTAKNKEKPGREGRRAMLRHCALVFALSAAALYMLRGGWLPLAGAALTAASHAGADALKAALRVQKRGALMFALDQALHLAVIAAVSYGVCALGASQNGIYSLFSPWLGNWAADNAVWTAAVAITCVWGAAHLIRLLLSDLGIDLGEAQSGGAAPAGRWIGMLERAAILMLIPLGQWAAAGLLLTAKSIARHRNLSEPKYAEYYLIGTLLSFITAVAGGLIISGIWSA